MFQAIKVSMAMKWRIDWQEKGLAAANRHLYYGETTKTSSL
jgi:hypothetical protein